MLLALSIHVPYQLLNGHIYLALLYRSNHMMVLSERFILCSDLYIMYHHCSIWLYVNATTIYSAQTNKLTLSGIR